MDIEPAPRQLQTLQAARLDPAIDSPRLDHDPRFPADLLDGLVDGQQSAATQGGDGTGSPSRSVNDPIHGLPLAPGAMVPIVPQNARPCHLTVVRLTTGQMSGHLGYGAGYRCGPGRRGQPGSGSCRAVLPGHRSVWRSQEWEWRRPGERVSGR